MGGRGLAEEEWKSFPGSNVGDGENAAVGNDGGSETG